jgi:hypothetical protein
LFGTSTVRKGLAALPESTPLSTGCVCATPRWSRAPKPNRNEPNRFLFSLVRAGFRCFRRGAVAPGTVSGKLTSGESRSSLTLTTATPVDQPVVHRDPRLSRVAVPVLRQDGVIIPASTAASVGLTLCFGTAYRWAVEPVSTGAACPRTLQRLSLLIRPDARDGRGRAVPADQAGATPAVRPGSRSTVSFPSPTPES